MRRKIQKNNWKVKFTRWEAIRNIVRQVEYGSGILILACVLYMSTFFSYAAEAGDATENIEAPNYGAGLVILFDKSGSMKNFPKTEDTINDQELEDEYVSGGEQEKDGKGQLSYGEIAIEWAQDICALIQDSDIALSVAFFDQNCTPDELQRITQENCMTIMSQIDNVRFDGALTNQYNAILKAEECVAYSKVGHKYIVILSDGDLDLDDMSGIDSKEEKDARKFFREKCQELAETGEYTIILVGMGQSVALYENLDEASDNIVCYNNIDDLEKLRLLLLHDMGIAHQSPDIDNNTFIIKKGYDRCIIRMELWKADNNSMNVEGEESFALFFMPDTQALEEESKIEATDVIRPSRSKAVYLYLDNPDIGKYRIDCQGEIRWVECLEKRYIEKVTLLLRGGLEVETKNSCVIYELKNNYEEISELKDLTISAGINTDLPIGATAKYYLKELENLSEESSWNAREGTKAVEMKNFRYDDRAWQEDGLDVEQGKSYACVVIVETKLQGECISNTIIFTVPEIVGAEPLKNSLNGDTKTEFPVEKYITYDDHINSSELTLLWDGHVLLDEGHIKETVDYIQINEDYSICFNKADNYIIQVKQNGSLKEEVIFYINPGKDCLFDRRKIIGIVIVVIAVILVMRIVKKIIHRRKQ